jgi:hypothetical protein
MNFSTCGRRTAILAFLLPMVVLLPSQATAATWSGASLAKPSGLVSTAFFGMSCYSSSACTAVGQADEADWGAFGEAWNGTSWTYQSGITRNPGPKNGGLYGVSCTAATTCMAAGAYGTSGGVPAAMAQSQSGSTWKLWNIGILSGASRTELNDVSCRTSSWCVAVGYKMVSGDDKAIAMGFGGSSWTDMKAIEKSNATLKGVSCVSTSYCVAVGSTGASPLAEVWNGFAWSAPAAQPPVPGSWETAILNAVHCVSEGWCMATGTLKRNESGTSYWRPFADIWNGSTWVTTTGVPWGGNNEGLAFGISCLSTTECWIVGEGRTGSTLRPWAVRWTGSTWEIQSIPLVSGAEGAQLRDISCFSSSNCKAGGWSLFPKSSIFEETPKGALVETVTP